MTAAVLDRDVDADVGPTPAKVRRTLPRRDLSAVGAVT